MTISLSSRATKAATLTALSAALLAFSFSTVQAKQDAAPKNWQNQQQCYKSVPADAPSYAPKRQVHIIGVGMNAEAELTRYELKRKVYNAIPDNFTFAEQGKFLDNLTHEDFITMQEWFERDGSKPSDDMVTPFDVGMDEDRTYIYVLLPRSWEYADRPIDLKMPARNGKHPFFFPSDNRLTKKAAIVNHMAVTAKNGKDCRYEFNLNVDMNSNVAGKDLKTRVIIDPGGGNNPNPPYPNGG